MKNTIDDIPWDRGDRILDIDGECYEFLFRDGRNIAFEAMATRSIVFHDELHLVPSTYEPIRKV